MRTLALLQRKLAFTIVILILVLGDLLAQEPYSGSGNYLQLDGIDDYASISDNSTLDIGTGATDDFTIECFFYIPDLNGTGMHSLIYKSYSYDVYLILSNTAQDRIIFKLFTSMVDNMYVYYDVDLSVGWHHIAASYDNEYTTDWDAMQVFLDGTRVVNASNFEFTPGINNSTSPLYIGGYISSINPYNGYIDEVRISDIVRYGSTYTVPSSNFSVDGNTRALWHFNELNGSTVFNDATSNNNTLTGINGAQTFGNCITPTITGTTDGSHCGTGTVSLEATASAGTINWYSALTGGTSLGTGTNYNTPSLSSTTVYYVDATNSSCTTATRTAVTATINTIPTITGTTDGLHCGTGTVSLGATASAGTINWYSASTGGTSLGTGTNYTTPSLSSTTVYYVDATDNGCTTATRAAVTAKDTCSTGINSISSSDKIKVYPNPTTGMFEISINEPNNIVYKIELFNNLGSLIKTITVVKNDNITQLDLSGYPAGLYLIKFDTKIGVFQYKIIRK